MDESDKQKSLGPGASLGHSTFTASWAIQHLQENRTGSDSHLHFLSHQSMEKQKVRVEEADEEEEEEEVQVRQRSSSSQQQRNWLFPSPACRENTSAGFSNTACSSPRMGWRRKGQEVQAAPPKMVGNTPELYIPGTLHKYIKYRFASKVAKGLKSNIK